VSAVPLRWFEVQRGDVVLGPHGPALVLDVDAATFEGHAIRVWWSRDREAGWTDVDPYAWIPVEPRSDPMTAALATIYRAFPTTQIVSRS
jgi:hypothetical protein